MKGAPTEADWPSWLLWQVPGPEGVNSAMTIPRRLGSAAVVATSFPLPVATYLIGPLLVQRVGVIPLALGALILAQAD